MLIAGPESYVTRSEAEPVLPRESVVWMVTVFSPGSRVTDSIDQLVVPLAVPDPPRSFDQITSVKAAPVDGAAAPDRLRVGCVER